MSIRQHLDKLHIFATIVELGSLGAASRRLAVSQPALSQTVKTLERASGSQLVVRSREGVELTASGRLLYESAIRILREAAAVEAALANRQLSGTRSLRVGIVESIAIYAWPRAQDRLRALFLEHDSPAPGFELLTGRTDEIMRRLSAGDIDVAIVIDPPSIPVFRSQALYEDSFYLYCSPAEPDRSRLENRKGSLPLQSSRPLFLFESARIASGDTLRSVLAALPVSFDNVNRVDSFEVASEFVRTGLGFALLPERVARKHRDSLHQIRPAGLRQLPQATHAVFACAPHTVAITLPFQLLCQAMQDR